MRRSLVAGLIASAVLLSPVAAWAHVTIEPGQATKGATDQQLSFRVPNENDKQKTVKVDIKIPTDHPLLGVAVEAVPGWTATVKTVTLPKPVKTDDGEITEAVSEVVWTGGSIPPASYANMRIIVGQLPDDAAQLEFKVLQTYDDGSTVSWIEDTPASGPEPEHPAPILTLKAAGSDASSSPASTAKPTVTATGASQSDVDKANKLAGVALAVGAMGLIVGIGGLVLARRGSAGS